MSGLKWKLRNKSQKSGDPDVSVHTKTRKDTRTQI